MFPPSDENLMVFKFRWQKLLQHLIFSHVKTSYSTEPGHPGDGFQINTQVTGRRFLIQVLSGLFVWLVADG
jgi:hypothetical protein